MQPWFPDFTHDFILDTDASDCGIGGILSQIDANGLKRVIAYGSRVLSKPERQCVTRRELLAVVTFTDHFRPYLIGWRFILRTDHGSLTWLANFKEPTGQMVRWLERLQDFDFRIEHRRGKSHTNADALSRLPCRQCGRSSHQDQTDALIAMAYLVPPENMGELQRDDPHISPVWKAKLDGKKPSPREIQAAGGKTK